MNKKPSGRRAAKKTTCTAEGVFKAFQKGGGVVVFDDETERVRIHKDKSGTALHNDAVVVEYDTRRKPPEGVIVDVLTRARTRVVGTVVEHDDSLMLDADDSKITPLFSIHKDSVPVEKGDKVLATLLPWDNPHKTPRASVTEVLGRAGDHDVEMQSLVLDQGFDWHFPHEVEDAAQSLLGEYPRMLEKARETRRDMRGIPTFTIDPDDAKDFDDAISIRTLDDGHIELGVHIADVSAFAQEGDAIDKEAWKRATSIYLVDRTIPMLPEVLSNNLCSLVPGEERLAFSAIFVMSEDGVVHERWFGETLILSDRRFTYRDAQDTLAHKTGELANELILANTIADALRAERFKKGSIAFETDEVRFVLDEKGVPIEAHRKERLDTNLLIEDLMLLANREVATWVARQNTEKNNKKSPFIWRIHDTPKQDRIEELALFLAALGYDLPHKDGLVSSEAINTLFEELEGKPEQELIETAAIRSMAKAIYSPKNIGHFGLAFTHYTHFTSPIRRYPDLVVHRTVKRHLKGNPPSAREYPYYEKTCLNSSEREVAAMHAERESIKLKQVEYLSTKIGEEFDGIVTGITEYGLFVQERETMAEGLVHVRSLGGDYFELRDRGFRLVGEKSGKTISLGDQLRIKLVRTDIEHKQIDWELVSSQSK